MLTQDTIRNAQYAILSLSLILSGCVVRTYQVTRDRVDQDLTVGNRGYMMGQAPYGETKERKTTRSTRVVEVELRSPFKFERKSKPAPIQATPAPQEAGETGQVQDVWGPQIQESEPVSADMEKYTVQKDDSLQKISKKFYGTTKNWMKLYRANKDVLKGPDKIYPGQVINIPIEGKAENLLKEPQENLK